MRQEKWNLASLNKQLASQRFLVIGRAGMDIYPDPPGTKTEEASQFFSCLGGSSANIAVALTRYGGHCALVTCVADDAIGRFALNQLDHYQIDRQFVRAVGGEARNSLAIVESRVEDHQSVLYRNGAADFCMDLNDIAPLPYADYSALITTGTVFAAEPSRSAAFAAFEKAKEAGLPLIFDLDYRPYSWASAEEAAQTYSRAGAMCDVIIGNDVEFGFMAGDYAKGLAKARALARETAAIVVFKMGEFGAITLTADEETRTGIYPVQALKPTGAGDAFMGGFIASFAQNYPLQEAVLRGSAAAAMVVERVGCAPAMPDSASLDAFIKAHPTGPIAADGAPF